MLALTTVRSSLGVVRRCLTQSASEEISEAQRRDASEAQPESFIEKAARAGVDSLLGRFQHRGGFDACLSELTFERYDDDASVYCSMPVTPAAANAYGTLHGGAISTLVDVAGTLAILAGQAKQPQRKAGVSVELNVSFLRAAAVGDTVDIVGNLKKSGKTLAFTDVEIRRRSDGELVAVGRHTKAL